MIKHHRICQRNQSLLRLSVLITLSLLAKVACATVYFKPLLVIWLAHGPVNSSGSYDPSAPIIEMAIRTWSTIPSGADCNPAASNGNNAPDYKPLSSMNDLSGGVHGVSISDGTTYCYGGAPSTLSVYDLWNDTTTTLTLGGPAMTLDFSSYNASQSYTFKQFMQTSFVHPVIYLPDYTVLTYAAAMRFTYSSGSEYDYNNGGIYNYNGKGTPTSWMKMMRLVGIGQSQTYATASPPFDPFPDGIPDTSHSYRTGPSIVNNNLGGNLTALSVKLTRSPDYLLTQGEPVFYVGF